MDISREGAAHARSRLWIAALEEIALIERGPTGPLPAAARRAALSILAAAARRPPSTCTDRPTRATPETREANLSAERATPQAAARLPRADADAGGARDPEAAAREGPEAPLGLTGPP